MDNGDSVLVIEHNLDVIKCADYVIDIGAEGGDEGWKHHCMWNTGANAQVEGKLYRKILEKSIREG